MFSNLILEVWNEKIIGNIYNSFYVSVVIISTDGVRTNLGCKRFYKIYPQGYDAFFQRKWFYRKRKPAQREEFGFHSVWPGDKPHGRKFKA